MRVASNYIISSNSVTRVSDTSSNSEYFISELDLSILISDSEVRKEFLESLGMDKVIVSHLGRQVDLSTYEKFSRNFVKVGPNKWK